MNNSVSRRFDLTGRVALVTGSSRGIGREIAIGLAEMGADVAIHYASQGDAAEDAAQSVRHVGRSAAIFKADLANSEASVRLVNDVTRHFNKLDILVLNASAEHRHSWDEMPDRDFDEEIALNLKSPIALMAAARPFMKAQRWGRILLIGSIQSARPNPRLALYASLKAGCVNLARNLAKQLGPEGITVNVLSPGAIATDRNASVLEDAAYRSRVEAQIPLGRIGRAADCVGAALLLCSDAGSYINGVELFVDGGWHAT